MALRRLSILIVATLTSTSAARGQHFPPAEDPRVPLPFVVEDGQVPGAVLGVLEADGSTADVAYGSAGLGAPAPGPRSTFEIGSITRTFTATLLAEMVLRGEVGLENPLSLYLPPAVAVPSSSGRAITLLDPATHRSGLPNPLPVRSSGGVTHRSPFRRHRRVSVPGATHAGPRDRNPDGFLTYRPGDRPRTPLFVRSCSSFYLLGAPITVTFMEGADGRTEMEMAIDEREPSQQRVVQNAVR